MPTQETQIVDNIIASRRALLMGGGAALAALALPKPAAAANTVTSYTDNDILNFALNLEYLEANFYYLAAFGTTIDVASSASTAAGAGVLGINGVIGSGSGTTAGIVANTGITGAPASSTYKVPFTNAAIAAYAVETAVEEGKHVAFLRSSAALGSLAVSQPLLNLTPANFLAIATAAKVPTSYNFNPYANDAFFLLGAYIFEDVGVSAYHGAAPLITGKTTVLPAAVGIHAVEAYHAGMVRTSIIANDTGTGITAGFPAGTLSTVTYLISQFRTTAAQALPQSPANPEDPTVDDYGVGNASGSTTPQTVTLNGSATTATQIVDAQQSTQGAPATSFARSTAQVLNIVTAGNAVNAGPAKGGFFPNGLNGLFV
jgi:hypothetical protein